MQKQIRRLYISAAIVGAALSPQAHASTQLIDFEPASLTGLYFAGNSFSQGDYTMSVDFDAGIVDGASSLGASAPTGNATQFYSQLNEGGLYVVRTDGGLFKISAFDAAFVPLNPAASGTTVMVAVGWSPGNLSANADFGMAWLFASSATSNFPFAHYGNPADFANFSQLRQAEFFACAYDGVNVCSGPLRNNGQFAIDNISVTSVPEPTPTMLLTLGLLALALHSRRSAR